MKSNTTCMDWAIWLMSSQGRDKGWEIHLDPYQVVKRLFGIEEAILQKKDNTAHHASTDEKNGKSESEKEEPSPHWKFDHNLHRTQLDPRNSMCRFIMPRKDDHDQEDVRHGEEVRFHKEYLPLRRKCNWLSFDNSLVSHTYLVKSHAISLVGVTATTCRFIISCKALTHLDEKAKFLP